MIKKSRFSSKIEMSEKPSSFLMKSLGIWINLSATDFIKYNNQFSV